jgi:hypothetical protein
MQSEQFIELSEKEYEDEKSASIEKSKLIESLKIKEKEVKMING